jgi:hypothetical protein
MKENAILAESLSEKKPNLRAVVPIASRFFRKEINRGIFRDDFGFSLTDTKLVSEIRQL